MDDLQKILNILDRPVAFHGCFADFAGITGAVMLSQALYWTSRIEDGRDGWFWKTQEEWERETKLSRREQETARKRLKEVGVLEESLRGNPAKLWYKVNLEVLYKQVWRNPPNKNGGNRQTNNIYTESTTYITGNNTQSVNDEEPVMDEVYEERLKARKDRHAKKTQFAGGKKEYPKREYSEKKLDECPNTEEGHAGCLEYFDSLAEEFGKRFSNFPLQVYHLHAMLKAGFTFEEINKVINRLEDEQYWIERGWDMQDVSNVISKNSSHG